jgi:hypothetical protein
MKISKPVYIILVPTFIAAGAILAIMVRAYAQCQTNETSDADQALWATFTCSPAAIAWYNDYYGFRPANWGAWGYNNQPCDINYPYAKALNAAYLIEFGLRDDYRQWHGAVDYRAVAQAKASVAHYSINYLPTAQTDWLAYAETPSNYTARYGRTLLGCDLFSGGEISNNPAARAGDYIHEGWHHWQAKYTPHEIGHSYPDRSGNCQMTGRNCDTYYWHYPKDYAFGYMHVVMHSANQTQVEYLSDLAVYANAFVPEIVKDLAEFEYNQRALQRFNNVIPYTLGERRPY